MSKRTNRRVLEFQSDRIEAVLARHKVSARVTGGMVSPRWIQFQVLPALGQSISKIRGLAEELAVALDSNTCRISRQGKTLAVEIPRDDPQTVHLLRLQHDLIERGSVPFCTAVLGLAEDGAPLLVRLPSPQVSHILIAGTTGSGKSALAQTIVTSLALKHKPHEVSFVLIDPKRRAFGPLAGLPHLLEPVLYEPEAVEELLKWLVRLMLDRDRRGLLPSLGDGGEARVVVVIDELVDLLMTSPGSERPLQRLAQRGREAGIHLVACTQKPAAAVIGSLTKANFPVRLVGRVTSPEDAKVATGYAGTGAERLGGAGDFIAVTGGQVTRFQAAYTSKQDLAQVVNDLRGNGSKALAVIDLPEPEPEEPEIDEDLVKRVGLARPVWRDEYRGNGQYAWGGKGRIAAAIFEDGNTSTAGHRFTAVADVCTILEQEADAGGVVTDVRGSEVARIPTTTGLERLLLRSKQTGEVFRVVVVGFEGGKWTISGR